MQRRVRGWVKRAQFSRMRARTVLLQARARGCLARRRHLELVSELHEFQSNPVNGSAKIAPISELNHYPVIH